MNNDVVKNSTAIISANRMFDIKFNGHICELIVDLQNEKSLSVSSHEKTIMALYQPNIPSDGIYQEGVGKRHACRYTKLKESHPDILSHLDYVSEFIAPKLGRQLSKTTVDFFTEMHYALLDFTENIMDTTDDVPYHRKIPAVLEAFDWKEQNIKGF
jgi:hypothetical protein